jgi:predicted outer membrane repeat protein
MYISWSNCVISQCLVKDNVSVNNGGGIYCTHASPVISNCKITGNISDNGGGGSGMGGGGICNNHMSYSTITGCIIYDNYSYGHGGGVVFNDRSDGSLTECSIFDNSSQDGAGGLYIGYASPIISTCTFSGNTTDSSGGAILVEFIGHPIITNNIIEGSFSLDGGIYLDSLQSTIIEYCDFFNNVVSNVAGSIIPEGFGLLSQVNNNGDSCDVFHNIFLNPLYVNQATGNFNLLINSPCIEAGNPLSAPDPDSTICDIGAFYYPQGEPGIYDLTITKIGVNNMLLDWSDIPGAGVYHIYRSDTPIFDITAIPPYIDTPNSHFFDYGTVISGTKWWYKVTWEE